MSFTRLSFKGRCWQAWELGQPFYTEWYCEWSRAGYIHRRKFYSSMIKRYITPKLQRCITPKLQRYITPKLQLRKHIPLKRILKDKAWRLYNNKRKSKGYNNNFYKSHNL